MATLIGTVAITVLDTLLYGFVFRSFLGGNLETQGIMKETPNFIMLIVANLCFALLLTYIFKRWANITTASGGAAAGTIIGFLASAGSSLSRYATSNVMNLTGTIVDTILFTIIMGAAGAVIGWYLGRDEAK